MPELTIRNKDTAGNKGSQLYFPGPNGVLDEVKLMTNLTIAFGPNAEIVGFYLENLARRVKEKGITSDAGLMDELRELSASMNRGQDYAMFNTADTDQEYFVKGNLHVLKLEMDLNAAFGDRKIAGKFLEEIVDDDNSTRFISDRAILAHLAGFCYANKQEKAYEKFLQAYRASEPGITESKQP